MADQNEVTVSLAEYLRNYIENYQLRIRIHSSTKLTPFNLIYGNDTILPSQYRATPSASYNYDDYNNEFRARLQHCHQIARVNLIEKKEKSKEHYDENSNLVKFKIGDLVLLRNEARKNKLDEIWSGQYPALLLYRATKI